ncbi:MAG: universal stress protein [Acidimicrobiales bacterium]
MMEPKKILVPSDLSERSEVGIAYAGMLARHLGSELVVMVNINLPERAILEESAGSEPLSLEEAARAALRRAAEKNAPSVTSSFAVGFRDFPAEGILDVATHENVDMIVIPSHGRSGMTRWMLGSVAEKIVRGADVPVVIVPARD